MFDYIWNLLILNSKKRSEGNRYICTVGILDVCRFMKESIHTGTPEIFGLTAFNKPKNLLEGSELLEMFGVRLFVIFLLCLNFHFNKRCMNFHWPLDNLARINPAKGLVE